MSFTAPDIAWGALSPVVIVLVAGILGVLVEAFVPDRARRTTQLVLAFGAPVGAVVAVAALWDGVASSGGTDVLDGSLLVDGPTLVIQGVIAVLTVLALLVVADRTATGQDAFAPTAASIPGSEYEELARRKGLTQTEVYPLLLLATGGMMILPATGDLLTLFVALEVLSLPLYLLTGMARRRRLLSQEAALKYFLLGAFASALLIFGVALVYGYSGTLRYSEIAAATAQPSALDPLLLVGAVLLLVGLLFKVGAVPFHSWTPDAYQGAPTPITGFMAACTKAAAFAALLRVYYTIFPGLQWDLDVFLWTVAIATMVVGTVVALVQTDIKRLLAYSSIAHAGFILTGVVALDEAGVSAVLFYLLAYGVATVGAFGVVWLVRERTVPQGSDDELGESDEDLRTSVLGEATHLSQWAGLGRTHPALAGAFALFLLSFAGIPLTAGFIGKFAVFSAAIDGGAWPLALVGVLSSAAAAFFYVRIIVLMYFTPAPGRDEVASASAPESSAGEPAVEPAVEGTSDEDVALEGADGSVAVATLVAAPVATTTTTVVPSEGLAAVAIGLAAVLTVVLGVFPTPVLDLISDVAKFLP
ncbi:NADH-quinone oxidoreductase subunit NuoN [Cellulomonas palmilytica]|uniref:NADH-quinone oxidoreductase subunit NuoN n=1 Tax=Cellulomonas palmilytica TaxID=2608402 RepID=UPI001F1921CD|nr:NADH-quinone oxidoreductase subunit NuoN [Cellulomonas palmilytica]UJP39885.1 NADH-quinone oxidoreductase subunit NuoN [Cellulomonas palmilytica]